MYDALSIGAGVFLGQVGMYFFRLGAAWFVYKRIQRRLSQAPQIPDSFYSDKLTIN